uniref:Calcium/calmodulin-dependent protein kinase II inhibitor 2 n=1 Tax=Danio rerio TaxID=7955 RepID=A0A0R4IFB4_DANRE|nr:calcium/calmodulin-dependent protein kinase II inhibitor 2 [Danio rerio]XP_002662861.1 calcium/calmodulin-dependent protein kinase II inhibitor 2 [Danio rerio]XP_021327569.1 calcium/calmodulin-dependent protein kinase II inhibitor 2 [Danio rerio]XP_021327570.1 calcium/calmodulin-dependent protein kinase II inhibitor 2 [Danio rerio]XP_021333456.1 calcium/calmodulin-dependent protein kinase II inhibitor 2 [Danio rerio]XP_021333457.1 calcium/calmodulin-dependent protein kinase II inhibitor 2 [|eukprot:XP_002662860.1 calcium/calmodulin-dependent protein kinase II inhibitor 2 [Danio rerio]
MNTPTEVQQQEDMYGMAEMPDLIPPAGALQPSPVIPYDHGQPGRNRPDLLSAPRRMQRAPKLGQIGRSTRVVIEDEDLDDIINNNRSFPVSQRVSPVA